VGWLQEITALASLASIETRASLPSTHGLVAFVFVARKYDRRPGGRIGPALGGIGGGERAFFDQASEES